MRALCDVLLGIALARLILDMALMVNRKRPVKALLLE